MKAQGATEMQCSKWQHYLPATTHDIGESLSQQHRDKKSNATDILFCGSYILSNIKLLSRQGLPFHGSGDDNDLIFYSLLN